jgi:predicted dehydrogenase
MATVDHGDLLARGAIDAVVIATPDHWHAAQLVHAAQARRHVYCEKPLTLTLEEAELCVRAVRKHGVVAQTGIQHRSGEGGRFRTAAALVRAGRLGRITTVSVHFGPTSRACDLPADDFEPGVDWDRWLGQAPARPYHHLLCQRGDPGRYEQRPGWRDFSEYSGGQVTDIGGHRLDVVHWALGMDGAGPTRALPGAGETSRGGGRLVYRHSPVGQEVVVEHRTDGDGVRFVGRDGELWVSHDRLASTPAAILREARVELPPARDHRRDWLDAIRSGRDPLCPVEVGARSAAACHLLNLAYWHGQPVGWNAATWSLVGAPAAWKRRPQRPGWELPRVA